MDVCDFPDLGKRVFRQAKRLEVFELDAGQPFGPIEE
jgi:hypothetical protein